MCHFFFFSAVLDNLTTSIVMAALISKMIKDKKDLWMFAGMIIISTNAGQPGLLWGM